MAIKKTTNRAGETVWTVRVDAGQKPDGKRRQVSRSFPTKREAESWAADVRGKLDRGTFIAPAKLTYGEFLASWLPGRRGDLRPSTYESYERMLRVHVVPTLGLVPLQQLGPERLLSLYADLGTRLSPRSVAYVHVIIHRSLKDAARWGKVSRNVATLVDAPRAGDRKELTTWTAAQVSAFLDHLQGDPLQVPVMVMARTGMRRGEVLGLRWKDVDLDAGRFSIRQTLTAPRDPETGRHVLTFGMPKTAAGRRTFKLDGETVAALRAHRVAQNKIKLMAGPGYVDHDLVVAEPDGTPLHPDHFRDRFTRRVARSGLPMIRVHDLRHTNATIGLERGIPAKVMANRLGHSKVSTTLDIYSHVLPSMDEDAAEKIAAAFGS
jgi:integrase